ncbi:MAG: aminopeptidase P N-terminal domain-containing protein [Gemmatimonadales bacterium]
MRLRSGAVLLLLAAALDPRPAASQAPYQYDFVREDSLSRTIDLDAPDPAQIHQILARRRTRVLRAIPDGAMLIYSVEWVQPRRLEFQVQHSDNHDFIYLTGIEGLESVRSALLLVPGDDRDWEVLYSSAADLDAIRRTSGIADVRPFAKLEEELSVALTDYRDWRITQIRRWPLPAALARRWSSEQKTLYLNYPRFYRLGMPEPERLAEFDKLRRFSPDVRLRDAADLLDPIRMYHDALGLASLRRAVAITGEGIVEAFRAARPGMTETDVMQMIDFVYRYRGADLGFPTGVERHPMTGRPPEPRIPEGFIQYRARSSRAVLAPGDLLHTDTGAEFNHYSADIQRNVAIDGTLNPKQRELYEIALRVQKTVIDSIRPGVTWWELHRLAERLLREAGGYDQYYRYGIGHFIGMEVHDEGDYTRPLEPGMALSIEQGVAPPGLPRVAFEDDVIVTATGREWVSRSIPIEIAEIEALRKTPSSLDAFTRKPTPRQ